MAYRRLSFPILDMKAHCEGLVRHWLMVRGKRHRHNGSRSKWGETYVDILFCQRNETGIKRVVILEPRQEILEQPVVTCIRKVIYGQVACPGAPGSQMERSPEMW